MNTVKNVGWVECGVPELVSGNGTINLNSGYKLKKILVCNNEAAGLFRAAYPHAEIVQDKNAMLHDQSLDLIIVSNASAHHKEAIGSLLEAGKQVQLL